MQTAPAPSSAPPRDLDAALPDVLAAPADAGPVVAIVRRPAVDQREVLDEGVLDEARGLVGDDWLARGSSRRPDGSADPDAQLTLMSTRVLAAVEPDPGRWPLAGDQLLVDLDLSEDNLPVGTRLTIGDALLEVTAKAHTGCVKFAGRFGNDALRWISTPDGLRRRMRGVYVRVVRGGRVRVGDVVRKA